MLRDKDVTGVVRALRGVVDDWYVATVADLRGLSSRQLADFFPAAGIRVPPNQYASVEQACHDAAREATAGDRILVFGSFRTIAEVLTARCEIPFAMQSSKGAKWMVD
jgi:dihydrofolate synthase/folylpolyglutamate synthase